MGAQIPIKFRKTSGGVVEAPGEFETGEFIDSKYLGAQPPDLYGTYSARPAANSVPAMTRYLASDTRESYIVIASAWVVTPSGGTELGYAERATTYSTSSDQFADVPGMSITYIAGENPSKIEFRALMRAGTATDNNGAVVLSTAVLALFVDGTQVQQILKKGTDWTSASAFARITGKTPGAVVVAKLRARTDSHGVTIDLFGTAGDVVALQALSC